MRSEKTESWLKREGVEFEFREDLPLQAISWDPQKSQVRLASTYDEDLLVRLQVAVEDDDANLPAVLVRPADDGGYQLIDGHHRCETLKRCGVASADAYVVRPKTDHKARLLAVKANMDHGKPPSEEERIEQAINLLDSGTVETATDAARATRVTYSKLIERHRARRTRRSLVDHMDPSDIESLPMTALGELHRIDNEAIRADAASVVLDAGLTGGDRKQFLDSVADQPTDKSATAVVESWREDLAERAEAVATEKPPSPIPSRFQRSLQSVLSMSQEVGDVRLVPKSTRQEVSELVGSLIGELSKLQHRLRNGKGS